eukprot:Opistho-2@12450
MVFIKPFSPNEFKSSMHSVLRQIVKKDDVVFENAYFKMTCPESWNVVYRLKGKLAKDNYRIQYMDFLDGKEKVIAQSESFDEIFQDWETLNTRVIPQLKKNPEKEKQIVEIIESLRSTVVGSRGSFRKASATNRLQEARNRFEEKLRNMVESRAASKHIQDYDIVRTLGTGSFGRVFLAKDHADQKFYAIKMIKKAIVIKLKQVEHTTNEKNILSCIDCPFVISLQTYFQDKMNLFFVIEYINGGEMFTHIHRQRHFSSEVTRFFCGRGRSRIRVFAQLGYCVP